MEGSTEEEVIPQWRLWHPEHEGETPGSLNPKFQIPGRDAVLRTLNPKLQEGTPVLRTLSPKLRKDHAPATNPKP